eukprot:3675273-Rhodomonas_salina.3
MTWNAGHREGQHHQGVESEGMGGQINVSQGARATRSSSILLLTACLAGRVRPGGGRRGGRGGHQVLLLSRHMLKQNTRNHTLSLHRVLDTRFPALHFSEHTSPSLFSFPNSSRDAVLEPGLRRRQRRRFRILFSLALHDFCAIREADEVDAAGRLTDSSSTSSTSWMRTSSSPR